MIKYSFFFSLIFASFTSFASLKNINELKSPFKLEDLPYSAKSLSPFIDEETMLVHHGGHHASYVKKLNKSYKTDGTRLYDLILHASDQTDVVKNNAGGHWNHTFFWSILSADKNNQKIGELLKKDIEKKFGTVENFQKEFEKLGKEVFGSGWVWLIRTPAGNLHLMTTANQDNPMMDTSLVRGVPILGLDLWEHAYYLQHKNERSLYLKNFWKIINWKQVSDYDDEAKVMKLSNNP